MNVVAYQRVSTQKQETERQQKEISDYCKINKFNLITEFVEKESGLKEQRTELTNLLNFCENKNNQVDYVMVVELSRLGRTKELLNTKDKLHSYGVGIIALKERLTSLNPDKTVNKNVNMIFGIMSSMNEYEVDVIKGRMRGGRITKTSQGYYMGNPKFAYGYIIKDKKLVINPTEAAVINEMVQMFLGGKGTYSIAKYLNQKGVETRRKTKWFPTVIYQILTNENLIGKRVYLDVEYECPAILDKITFEKIQERLRNKANKQGINQKHEYLFNKQKIECGVCNRSYYPTVRKGGKGSVYSCTSKIYPFKPCGNRGIGITKIESSITDFVFKYFSEVIINNTKNKNFKNDIEKLESKLIENNTFLKKEKSKENILLDLLLNGSITDDVYKERLKIVKNEILNLSTKIEKIESELYAIKEIEKKQSNIEEIYKIFIKDGTNKKEYVTQIIDKIIIHPEPNKVMSNFSNDNCFRIEIIITGIAYTIYLSQRSKSYETEFDDEKIVKDALKNKMNIVNQILK